MKRLGKNILYLITSLLRYGLWLLLILFIITVLSVIISWHHWKSLGENMMLGKNQISLALNDLNQQNWPKSIEEFQLAHNSFQAAKSNLNDLRLSWLPAKVKIGSRQLDDLEKLDDTAIILSRAAGNTAVMAQKLTKPLSQEKTFKSLTIREKADFIQSFIALEPELNGLKADLNLALFNLNSIHNYGILWPLRGQISNARDQIEKASLLLSQSTPLLRLLPAFSGYPQQNNYLIMLQNNDELRPTGGFLGSYALLNIKPFAQLDIKADDVYHLDMPSIDKTNFEAPEPITKYLKVKNWYLRDANWSPDWPSSAQNIEKIFNAENQAAGNQAIPLNGVFAITPNFVANLLRLTGPIEVKGESYAPENMQALLQYNVEVAYKDADISSWDRKDIINDLIKALEEKLVSLPISKYPDLLSRLAASIERKDILLYFNNPGQENIATSLGADGRIQQVPDDYLMVVDANLAAFKSDAVMSKNFSYNLKKDNDKLLASLKLDYRHNGGFDWRTTRYQSYTRILTPLGSNLISVSGIEKNQVLSYDDKNLNKHVFGFYWTIEPGSSKQVSLEYNLADNILQTLKTQKLYSLYIQRQPGSRVDNFHLNLDLDRKISSVSTREAKVSNKGVYLTPNLNDSSQNITVKVE